MKLMDWINGRATWVGFDHRGSVAALKVETSPDGISLLPSLNLPLANGSNAGLLAPADKTKLNGLQNTLVTVEPGVNFQSRAQIIATVIPDPQVLHIRTAGGEAAGDGGGALYARAPSEPAHGAKIQSADGAWWTPVFENGQLSILAISATPNHTHLQAACDLAQGACVIIPRGVTVTGLDPVVGAMDVHIAGQGVLDFNDRIFEVDGSVCLEGITVRSNSFAVTGQNVTGIVDYTFEGVSFENCVKCLEWRVLGTGDYLPGLGIRSLVVDRCSFDNGLSIALHLDTHLQSAVITNSVWRNQKFAGIWISAITAARQQQVQNITVTNNRFQGVSSSSATDVAAAAIMVQGVKVNISDNIVDDVSTIYGASDGVEAWGIYTKAIHGVIANNVVSNVVSDNMAAGSQLINIKGSNYSEITTTTYGYEMLVTGNICKNTADTLAIGVHIFCDRAKIIGNQIQGCGIGMDTIGSEASDWIEIADNTILAPPPSYRVNGLDLRLQGGRHRVLDNRVGGYDTGIQITVQDADVQVIEMYGNICETMQNAFRFRSSTPHILRKAIIGGGIAEGDYLARWDDAAVTPDIEFDGIDVGGITEKFLFTGAIEWKNGRVANLRGHRIEHPGATTIHAAYFRLAEDTIASVDFHVTAQSAGGTAHVNKRLLDTWARAGTADPVRLGAETVLHEVATGGIVRAQSSGTLLQLRTTGVDSTPMSYRISFEAVLSNPN